MVKPPALIFTTPITPLEKLGLHWGIAAILGAVSGPETRAAPSE